MGRIPQTRLSLSGEVRKQRDQITNKGTLFEGTGIHFPSPGVIEVDGELRGAGFDGDLANDDAGTTGFALSATKAAMPELLLRPGSVGNDALANPVVPGVVNLYTSNFSLPSTSYAEITGVNLTVPAGCTILAFTGTGSLDCYNAKTTGGNNGSGGDYIYPQVRVGSNTSPGNWATGVSGNSGNATATRGFSTLLTGLTPGATVRASVYGVSDYGISADPGNLASLSATLNWFR